MIQSGLFNKLATDPSIQALLPSDSSVSPALALAYKCIHFGRAPKQPTQTPQTASAPLISLIPYLIIHLPGVPPAEETLDGVTDLRDGEIQFDAYANDINGAQTARQLANAVRQIFLPDGSYFSGTLSDGTSISFYSVVADFDDNYEVGGVGFLFRSVLKVKAFYIEGSDTF